MTTNIGLIPRKEGRVQIGKLVMLLVLAALLLLTLTRPYLALTSAVSHSVASCIRQTGYTFILILALMAAWIDKRLVRIVPVPLPIVMLLMWCWFSLSWSAFPSTSLSRLILTTSVVWLAFLCVDRLGARRSILLISIFLGLALLGNYAVVFFNPAVGIANYSLPGQPHEWRGFMGHKNIAGTAAALTGLAFLFNGHASSRLPRYALILASMVFLGFSQSLTSIIGMVIAAISGLVINKFGQRIVEGANNHRHIKARWIGIVICALVAGGGVLITLNGSILLDMVANPSLWTGRGRIWQPMLMSYLKNPILGTGFGAFWAQPQDIAAVTSDASNLNGVTQGHNGYLDIITEIGLPGLLMALIAVVYWPINMFVRIVQADVKIGAFTIAMLAFFIVNNIAETSIFDGDQIPHVFAMLSIAIIMTTVRRRRVSSIRTPGSASLQRTRSRGYSRVRSH